MIAKVRAKKDRARIVEAIERLAVDPDKQGKNLAGDLHAYRSLRVTQRYRILYKVEIVHEHQQNRTVTRVRVVAVGLRKEGDKKDVYALAQKLLERGQLP